MCECVYIPLYVFMFASTMVLISLLIEKAREFVSEQVREHELFEFLID